MIEDKVLRDDWVVTCRESDLTEKPLQQIVLGERIVLFRNSKGVYAFKDLCVHRGAALSLGCVKDDQLVCPYHGWEYGDDGQCTKIPQLPEGTQVSKKAQAFKYGCKVAYGFIWVNINNNNPDFFPYKESTGGEFRNVIWGPQSVEAKPPRIVENFLDVGHLAFVHVGFLGVEDKPVIGDYRVVSENDRLYTTPIEVYQPDPDGSGEAKNVLYTYEILRPLTVRFTKEEPTNNTKMTILLTIKPVEDLKSVAYGILSFNYETGQSDEEIVAFQDMIFSQDKPIVENQKPEELPLDLQAELSLKFDRLSIAYRQYLKKLGVVLGVE